MNTLRRLCSSLYVQVECRYNLLRKCQAVTLNVQPHIYFIYIVKVLTLGYTFVKDYEGYAFVFLLKCDIYYAFTFQPQKILFKIQVTFICLN